MSEEDEQRGKDFQDLFAELEGTLRRLSGIDEEAGFADMVNRLRNNRAVASRRDLLFRYKTLRNLLMHRNGQRPVAYPTAEALTGLRRAVEAVRLSGTPLPTNGVRTVSPDTPLLDAARTMTANNYSQVPVIDGSGSVAGLLTFADLAAWLARTADGDGHVLLSPDATVGHVAHESGDDFAVIPRTTTRLAAADMLCDTSRATPLDALLITHNGKRSEKPLGILTRADLPTLL